ncbi:MAG: hypothetical protein ABJB22_07210 [Verrucomicrobiota bacterium]
MNRILASRQQRALPHCAPFSEKRAPDRAMRVAVYRTRKTKATTESFSWQQNFDRTAADLVRAVPIPPEISEWFANEKLLTATGKRSWKTTARNPVTIAIALALLVIGGIFAIKLYERMQDFPGSGTARKLLTVASATRLSQLDKVQSDVGELGDLFFLKHHLEHYDAPPEFARFRTLGSRVFDDDEGHRVAQMQLAEKRVQLFLFAAEKQKDGHAPDWSGWRYVEQEGWAGAVQQRNGVCFMAALRGKKKDIASYLPKSQE